MDSTGAITFATDKQYATVIRTYENGHAILEQYLDAEGNPAVQPLGHCALARSYTADGLADVITYLDQDGQPVVTSSGYTAVHRTYTDRRLAETDTYFIDDVQVRNYYGFYSLHREYDENKRVSEITYLDENGQLTLHKNGYARIARTYNEAGEIEYEYYFDTKNEPAAASSGNYGLYREYDTDGNTILTVYLDAEGHPMDIGKGYASIARTYAEDGSVATARYFDAAGEPVTMGRGQYGYKYVNGQSLYLDEEGEPMLRLDTYLNTHPLLVLILGVLLTILALFLRDKSRAAFLIAYILFIVVMTIWYRETGDPKGQFRLFWSYRQFLTSESIRQQIIHNIWLFVPLGAGLFDHEHPHRWLWAAAVSIVIEGIQYVAGVGLCEIDDVISNGLGALIGFFLASQYAKHKDNRIKTTLPST